MSHLIIIRGNSGSGKSTVAKRIRQEFKHHKTALIEQDNFRRHILGEIGRGGDDTIALIELVTRFALDNNYLTIVEGILSSQYYGEMLKRLVAINPKKTHVFYMDISLEETLRRHETKPNRNDFGEAEMRKWYQEKDLLGVNQEVVIREDVSLDKTVDLITTQAVSCKDS